jgi:Protein of unknown function (DUF1524)
MITAKPPARYGAVWERACRRLCSTELHHHWGHDRKRIGNLVLLPAKSNAALGNNDFKTKAAVLGQAPYELTRQVAGVAEWTLEMIANRQTILAGLALKTWPL